ncbi:PREDICTED: uncharacterized protein LOC108754583 [Trachymyrmex septentrionalis]|uniref:uncharacterized protein LOC108754583 n=1 Tax=Trachymyrmex septentrionalis TaxID=34720 RepID=UPI00084EE08E|nr:PREDICTED: uncharacterized protein LOC108754583 [Trachymyrmex septentrionalis]XP_018352519.1 PREDICTED: uncharacterized protein LOC108754583 [Trachymyrmex septentrionalis]
MEEEDRSHYIYLLKNLPTCLANIFEYDNEEERSREIAVALMTCYSVYLKKYAFTEVRDFRTKQVVQIYKSLLSKGDEYVTSPEAWQKALRLEAKRERKFIMNTLTTTTREKLVQLMEEYRVSSEQWYLLLNLLFNVKKNMKVLPNGSIQLPPGKEIDDIINIICRDEIEQIYVFTYSLIARLRKFYSVRQIVRVLVE